MVKVFKSIFLAFSLIVLAGCSNLANTIKNPESDNQTSHKITAFITEDCSAILNSSSRSILPESILSNTLYYYLVAENLYTHQTYISNEPLEIIPDTSGFSFDFNYPLSYYEFTMYAVTSQLSGTFNKESLRQAAVLWGTTTADLRNKDKVSISLSSRNLPGRGSVVLKLHTTSDWTADFTKNTIYAVLKAMDGTILQKTRIDDLPCGSASSAQFYLQIDGGLQAGTYLFEVDFINKNTNKNYTYETNLIVQPNQDTVATVAIPNVIEYEPSKPLNLKAGYKVYPSSEKYDVNFTWTDTSNNEYYFELDILSINNAADYDKINPQTEWTGDYLTTLYSIAAVTTYSKNFESAGEYVAGSLQRNKTSATLQLDLGQRYLARIRAVNDAGASEYSYLDLSAGGTGTAGFTAFAADSHCINRYRMTYNLNGGTLTYSDGTPDATGSIVSYHTQGETVPVLKPDTAPVSTITSDTKNFESWTKGGVGGTLFNETSYSGFANLDLYAKYQE